MRYLATKGLLEGAFLACGVLAVGCVSRPGPLAGHPGSAGGWPAIGDAADLASRDSARWDLPEEADPSLGGAGAVRVRVAWPRFRTQAIPLSATAVDLDLLSPTSTIATASIVRAATDSATLRGIATGSYTIRAVARREDGTVAAQSTASVVVRTNRVASATLALAPASMPRLDFISPAQGPPGSQVILYGVNLRPPAGSTYSVLVDGQPVSSYYLQAGDSYVTIASLPGTAATSAISIVVDGIAIPASQMRVFRRLTFDRVEVSPATLSLQPGATCSFTAKAFIGAGTDSTEVTGLPFQWSLAVQIPAPSGGGFGMSTPSYTLSEGYLQVGSWFSTGSVTVKAEAGNATYSKFGTASVVVE